MVIRSESPVHCALWLIVNLVSLAVLYYVLHAPFLMAVQLIVYAGAIVVLFLFVVMLLSSRGEAGSHPHLRWLRPAALVGAFAFLAALLILGWMDTTRPVETTAFAVIGDPASIGRLLYTKFLLPFEATSILLLAALVGALYLGRHGEHGTADDYGVTEDRNV